MSLVLMSRPARRSTLFPYTTLFRSRQDRELERRGPAPEGLHGRRGHRPPLLDLLSRRGARERLARPRAAGRGRQGQLRDRKSTRLNSSHVSISYAVFCLKKKTKKPF